MGNTLVVIGLGNPDPEYQRSRHNIGFMVLDEIAGRLNLKFRSNLKIPAWSITHIIGDKSVIFVKPRTYMNNSGEVVRAILKERQLNPEDFIIVMDDIDLKVGKIRIRKGGSHGGHKGLLSIIEALSSTDFIRVRVGVGRSQCEGVTEYILRSMTDKEYEDILPSIRYAADAVICVIQYGVEKAMNMFNGLEII